MEKNRLFLFINGLSVYIYWWACFWGASIEKYYIGPLLAMMYFIFHFYIIKDKEKEFKYMLFCIFFGFLFESLFYYTGFMTYKGILPQKYSIVPIWVIILWSGYSLTVFHSFKWILGRYKIALIISCLFAPLIYLSANRVGSISFTISISNMYLILAFMWSLCFPLLIYIATKLND